MTISFMVLGGPRSATTWLANLLTTDTTLCLHDPLIEHTSIQIDDLYFPGKSRVGIADTSALLWLDWLRAHPAKKIILWRDPGEINASLRALGLRELDPVRHSMRVHGLPNAPVYPWQSVFNAGVAYEICRFFDIPFCRYRFQELVKMNVQPHFSRLPVGREAAQALVQRLIEEIK